MQYEFAFPYENEDLGDSVWQVGRPYQIAILVNPSEEFKGITGDTWMSDQIYIRLGSPSQESIYYPPFIAQQAAKEKPHVVARKSLTVALMEKRMGKGKKR